MEPMKGIGPCGERVAEKCDAQAERPGYNAFESDGTRFASLAGLLAHLKQGAVVPLPQGEAWCETVTRISTPGQVAEIDEDTFGYFLDVLPPRWMGPGGFAFGEGYDRLRLFWRSKDGRYFCRQLDRDENAAFCRLAAVPLSSG
jgi:hypothetical protein